MNHEYTKAISDWSYRMYEYGYVAGNTVVNQNSCWEESQRNVRDAVGIFLDFTEPTCHAIIDVEPFLPWPRYFPTDQKIITSCILQHLSV